MSSGYSANCAWTITWENIKEIVPKNTKELEEFLGDNDIDDLCLFIDLEDGVEFEIPKNTNQEKYRNKLIKIWNKLQLAFKKKTGLDLFANYVFDDLGDIYDDVVNGFFTLDGVQQMTENGEKMKDKIAFSQWVIWG